MSLRSPRHGGRVSLLWADAGVRHVRDGEGMNITAAARTFGLSRRTLYNWMDAGFLAFTLAKGSRQVRSEDVQVCVSSKWTRCGGTADGGVCG